MCIRDRQSAASAAISCAIALRQRQGCPLGTLSVPRAPRRANTNSFARMRTKATIGNGHRQRSATAIGNDRQEPSAATWLRTAWRPHEHRPSPRFSSARWRRLNVMEAARSTCTMSSNTGMPFDDIAPRCRNGSCSRARAMEAPTSGVIIPKFAPSLLFLSLIHI